MSITYQSESARVREVADALRVLSGGAVLLALRVAKTIPETIIDNRELLEALGWAGLRAWPCRCGHTVEFVDHGPQPGWWRHTNPAALEVPHAAEPRISRVTPDSWLDGYEQAVTL
jgi:hypothetical protein